MQEIFLYEVCLSHPSSDMISILKPYGSHRHPSSHACPPEQPDDIKNKTARALLAQHFPSKGISASSTPTISNKPKTTDPKKLAQIRKVQLMKMRHSAIPADLKDKTAAVTIDQRIHLQVTLEGDASTTKVFWFRKVNHSFSQLDPVC
jgi:hypothetical protein